MFAVNVAINLPVKNLFRQFTYSVPEALQFIDSGWRVVVPFSGQKVEGFVVERVPLPSDEVLRSKLKPVEAALGDTPWFDKEMLATAKWMEIIICVRWQRRCAFSCRENRALSGVPCVMRRDVCFIMFIMSVCRKKLCWLTASM